MASMEFDPPLQETYTKLSSKHLNLIGGETFTAVKECELPLINLSHLISPKSLTEREKCVRDIAEAASDWGFFQVINHGISEEVLKSLNYEERKVFRQPFNVKARNNFMGLSPNSYRWGNPRAKNVKQLSWSEAFHISMADLSGMNNKNLRMAMEKYANAAENTSKILAETLIQNLGYCGSKSYFQEKCVRSSCYLRMNRYPPCFFSSSDRDPIFGLIPHTDSDFLSVVNQDLIGGLQLFKDGAWIAVKPNPNALVINIGDLFQALSNGIYKSLKHRVVASKAERLSAAYFYCPTNDLVIESLTHEEPRIYRNFTFREFQRQNQKDVQDTGDKIGLKRFII